MGYTLVYTQVLEFFPYLIRGALISLQIAILAFFGGMFFGLIFATIRTFGNKLMNNLVIWYVTFFTNTPQLVQIYFLFFALPEFGILLSPFVAVLVGMTLNAAKDLGKKFKQNAIVWSDQSTISQLILLR